MTLGEATRIFWAKHRKRPERDDGTMFTPRFPFPAEVESPLTHLREFYEPVRSWLSRCEAPGLAIAAIDGDGLQVTGYLRAKKETVNTAIVGRHGRAEIHLGGDPSVSLRHLAVILHRSSSKEAVRFRVLDLRTSGGFTDARGGSRRAIEANGPYVAGCGDYSVVFAPVTDPPIAWPDDPERFASAFDFDVLTSPETLDGLRREDREDPLGELVVASREGTGAVPVSRRSVGAGILLGRSDRCDGEALLGDPYISRVHLLIVEIAGDLYAIDTASKNGSFAPRKVERVFAIETGTKISLSGVATVEWRFFH